MFSIDDSIPPEIIQRIFRLCCGSVVFQVPHEPYSRRGGTTQVTLSLVCSRWRAIALNTSSLWGDVMVYYDACTSPGPRPSSFRFVRKWLKRARKTPVSLSISAHEATSESEIDAVSPLLSSCRIKNLELESIECRYFLVPSDNSYYVERLHLTFDELVLSNNIFPRIPEMPSLKELQLCLDLENFGNLIGLYLIPWHQLRILTLSEISWPSRMLLNILQRCKSLVKCTLLVALEDGKHAQDVVLPDLERLVLDMNEDGNADPIIRSLIVPKLRSLVIKSQWSWYSLSTEAFVVMAHRSGFKHLTNFSLRKMKQRVDVRSLLGCMPALKRVTLRGPLMFQPGTFDDLSSGTIGPQLEEIYFGIMRDEEIPLLLEAVGQRHEKAKAVPDIRPFASVTCRASGNDLVSHEQRAKQCSEAFNANVAIRVSRDSNRTSDWGESDLDFDIASESASDEESYMDDELGSNTGAVFVSDEDPLEESNSDEESHSFGESESHEESSSFEDSSSDEESYWESDEDVDLDPHSDEESDPGADT